MLLGFCYRGAIFFRRRAWEGFTKPRERWLTSAKMPSSRVLRTNRLSMRSKEPSHSSRETSSGRSSWSLADTDLLPHDHADQLADGLRPGLHGGRGLLELLDDLLGPIERDPIALEDVH